MRVWRKKHPYRWAKWWLKNDDRWLEEHRIFHDLQFLSILSRSIESRRWSFLLLKYDPPALETLAHESLEEEAQK